MIARAFLMTVAAMALALPLHAQADDANALAELAKPGRVLMLRHAVAPGFGDPPQFTVDDCATQRNLDDRGRQQARALGARLRAAGIRKAIIFSSQWCRCIETGRLLKLGVVVTNPALNSFHGRPQERDAKLDAVGELIAGLPVNGPPVILVTHQVTISGITGRGVGSGGGYVLRLDGSPRPPVVGALALE